MHLLQSHFEKLIPLSDAEFEYILSHFKTRKIRKNQYLIQEGDSVANSFWVMEGAFRLFFTDSEGREHILQFAVEDWWLSDYQAYYSQGKASLNAICMESGTVLALSLENYEKLCAEFHVLDHFFRKKSNAGYVALQKRITSLLSDSPLKKYEEFSKTYPGLMQRIPKKYIASYLGISRETLSRLYTKKV